MDRIKMLINITSSESQPPELDIKMFEDCIQEYYPCVYSLYSLFVEAKIDITRVKFKKPNTDSDTLSIGILFIDENDYDKLFKVIKSNSGKLNYLRNHPCSAELKGTIKKLSISITTLH